MSAPVCVSALPRVCLSVLGRDAEQDRESETLAAATLLRGGRWMDQAPARKDGAWVPNRAAAPAASRAPRWGGGLIGLLLLMTLLACGGAWVDLVGYRVCALSYLVWR